MSENVSQLNKVCAKLEKLNPKSVFLYGSRAREDYLKNSDYEIGVLFSKKNYLSRSKLKVIFEKYKDFNIYPFEYEKFIKRKIDTPFQKNIYLKEIIEKGKTIVGEEIEDCKFQNFFVDINGSVYNKMEAIMEIMRKNNFKSEQTIFIGDMTHDVDAGKKAGMTTIAISQGYQLKETLLEKNPDFLIEDLEELKNIVLSV